MKSDILKFLKKAHQSLGIEAHYYPDTDVYVVSKNGKGVQNFTTRTFYMQPKGFRFYEWRALIKLGLNQNMGERSVREQINVDMGQAKRLKLNG
jgi:hypothetical protein